MGDISHSSHHSLAANRIKLRWDWAGFGGLLNPVVGYPHIQRDTQRHREKSQASGGRGSGYKLRSDRGRWPPLEAGRTKETFSLSTSRRNGGPVDTFSLNFQFLAGWKDLFLLFKATKCLVLCMTGCKVSVEWNPGIELYFSSPHFLSQGPFEWGF